MHRHTHHVADFATQTVNIFTLLTDNNTGAGGMDRDPGVLSRALDHDLADRRLNQTLVEELANLNVIQQILRVVLLVGIPH